jgi:hypothetical protein
MAATDNVEDLCNQAARAAGIPLRMEDIYEGSDLSAVALEIYSQARDELLDAKDWSFNRRTSPLTMLKGPPPNGGYSLAQPWSAGLYPAPGWLYEYDYPNDAVDLRAIIPPPLGLMPDLDPMPAEWRVDNDPLPNIVDGTPTGPEAKVIYCHVTNALAVYRGRVTDPSIFDPGFISALVALMGKRFAVAFGADVNKQREDGAEAVAMIRSASDVRG